MSKLNAEEKNLKKGKLSRDREALRALPAKCLQEVVGGITPSIPIPPP
jgi:hypothetical protein